MRILKKNRKMKDCGVIAAYNASVWCDKPKTYRDVEKLARSCGYHPEKGIYFFQFSNLLKKLGLPAEKIQTKSLDEFIGKLRNGKFFVFLYTPSQAQNGHAISIFVNHEGKITLINPDKKRFTWMRFCKDLMENGVKNYAIYEMPRKAVARRNDVSRTA